MLKNKLIVRGIAFAFFAAAISSLAIAQCTQQVTHLSGSIAVNGVNVTVTSAGFVSSLSYCTGITTPYIIGYSSGGGNGNGSYTFSFSPPVTGVTLNFGGTSNVLTGGIEEVSLYVNGSHYAIPSPGTLNPCEPMAVLTAAGDIAGCTECSVCGWSGTTVPGPISTIMVFDSVIALTPNGTVFSLFICDSIQTGIEETGTDNNTVVYPNPLTCTLHISTNENDLSELILYDFASRKLIQESFKNSISLNTSQIIKGVYFYEIRNKNRVIKKGKIVKE